MFEKASTAMEELAGMDPRELARDEVVPTLEEVIRLQRRLEAIQAGLIARVDDDGLYADAGYHARDTKDLLERFGVSRRDANQRVLVARTLSYFPTARTAFAAGSVGVEHIATMGRVVSPQTADTLREDERVMAGWATSMPHRHFATKIADWAATVDPTKHDAAIAPSTLSLSKGPKGRGIVAGSFNATDHSKISPALVEEAERVRRQEDKDRKAGIDVPESTHEERLAAAWVSLTRRALNGPDDQICGTSRAQVAIVVSPEELAAGTGGHDVELDQPVGPAEFAEFCCDAHVYRTVMDASAAVLDVGRSKRTATGVQRAAVVIRDRTCVVPHCDALPRWCEIHHVVWFRNGGCTTISNLVLVCGRHHTQIHQGKIRVTLVPGQAQQFRFENEHGGELRRPDLEAERHTEAA